DGTELEAALGIGSFAEKTLVAAGQCTKIDAELEDDQHAAVGLLGCGVMAGIGAAINTGELKRGESMAAIGCGGVGMAAIQGAKLAGSTTIIAVDIDDEKLAQAKTLGATHTVNSKQADVLRPFGNLPMVSVLIWWSRPLVIPKFISRLSTPATLPVVSYC